MKQEQVGRTFFDLIIELHDKSPIIASAALLIVVITPMFMSFLKYKTKTEELNLKFYKNIANQRGKNK